MKEERISYLCTQAARGQINLNELSELLGYVVLDPEIAELVFLERAIRQLKNDK